MNKIKADILSEKEWENILRDLKLGYAITTDIEIKGSRYWNWVHKNNFVCFCEDAKGEEINSFYCPYCGNGIYNNTSCYGLKSIIDENCKNKLLNYVNKYPEEKSSIKYCIENKKQINLYKGFYVRKHEDYKDGVQILKININVKNQKGEILVVTKVENIINIIPNREYKAYKIVRGKQVETDLLKTFNLNSKTKDNNINIKFQDSKGMVDFLLKNQEFTKHTACLEMFNEVDCGINRNSFFLFFMYLLAEYPIVEFLVKMGFTKLIANIITQLANSCNKDNLREKAENLEKIFNPHAEKGKFALNLPNYISQFLKKANVNLDVFELWTDLNELEPISKELFHELIQNPIFVTSITNNSKDFVNLLKYGYKLKKLTNYIAKQKTQNNLVISDVITYIKDYNNMAELLDIKVELYPKDIEEMHDKMQESYLLEKNKLENSMIERISTEATKLIPNNEHYTIVMPNNVVDLVQERQNQHNCVASYANSIIKGNCVIFFIREKENPTRSFVTAEYRSGMLYQIKEKNNYSVRNKEVLDYAKEFCKKLSQNKMFRMI